MTNRSRRAVPICLSLFTFAFVSCTVGPESPTSPTLFTPRSDLPSPVAEYFVTLADTAPEPSPSEPPAPSPVTDSWPPGPPPRPSPGAPVPEPPSTHFRVLLKVDPEPVPYSGRPVTDTTACRDLPHTWYYDQHLHAETGIGVTFTERENFFDGRFVSRNSQTIQLQGNGTVILRTRWCSGHAKFHYAQTRFKGRDENGEPITISGPWVRLLAP